MKQHFLYTEGGGFKPKKVEDPESIEFIIIDLFCGAGGTTTGFDRAKFNGKKIALIAACVNHDPKAIKSHWLNHPDVIHFEEDIRTLKLSGLADIVLKYRLMYPKAKVILWASLECTNFSKAKGGQPRDADSRTLAENLYMHWDEEKREYYTGDSYLQILSPDYLMIENVVEFMSWGPLDANGKPVSKKSGTDWMRWRKEICALGYHDQWKEMNSADFGAYTSRNRLFGCFAKHGLPIIWPKTTHAKKPEMGGLFGESLLKWKPVKDVLDFEDEGTSIFNRKKPLVDASLERIEAGLIKFVVGGKDNFILKYNSTDKNGKHTPPSTDDPCPTIACQNRLGIVHASFISKYYSGKPEGMLSPVTSPMPTLRTKDGASLINTSFISKNYSGRPAGKVASIESPSGTVTTFGGGSLVTCTPFIMDTNFKNVGSSIDEPSKTLLASRHYPYIINPCFLTQYYSTGGQLASIDEPARTLSTKDRIAKVQPVWLDKMYSGTQNIASVEGPAGTVMTCDKHWIVKCDAVIYNPSHGGHTMSTEVPCPVIIARQDKSPLYLIKYSYFENITIPIYDTDSAVMIRIKKLMAELGISDIKMRMLKVEELLLIQGFGKDYQLDGTQADQKKFIGNSVHPLIPEHWIISMTEKFNELRTAA